MNGYDDIITPLNQYRYDILQIVTYQDAEEKKRCLIIFDQDPEGFLSGLNPLRVWCKRKKVSYPLIVNRAFILSSQDSYPLELMGFSCNYQNLYCREDVLQGLSYLHSDVKLQMERELKSKWLLTRMSVLETDLRPDQCAGLLRKSVVAILPVFYGIHFLRAEAVPTNRDYLIKQTGELIGMDLGLLQEILSANKLSMDKVQNYLMLLEQILIELDESF